MFFGSGTSFGSDYSIVVPVPQEFEYLGSVDFNPMFRILIEIRYRSYLLKKLCFSGRRVSSRRPSWACSGSRGRWLKRSPVDPLKRIQHPWLRRHSTPKRYRKIDFTTQDTVLVRLFKILILTGTVANL